MESFNKNIHPLSIFHGNIPDFRVLSEKYPRLKKRMSNNKLDFKKWKTCAIVCKVLLQEYFSIDYWKIPYGHLVPAVPQRLNYLCWVREISRSSTMIVLDIGTGSNLIFPLLGVTSFNWSFIGTEKSKKSLKNAEKIVKKNSLQHKIRLIRVKSGILKEIAENFDFSICNPPFFEHSEKKSDGFGGRENEMCVEGGELEFIKQYIIESWSKRQVNRFFSSLVGIKKHLDTLTAFLNKNFPSAEVQTTTLYQGNTLRWALAWKFTAVN